MATATAVKVSASILKPVNKIVMKFEMGDRGISKFLSKPKDKQLNAMALQGARGPNATLRSNNTFWLFAERPAYAGVDFSRAIGCRKRFGG
jgi:hypothetical protein